LFGTVHYDILFSVTTGGQGRFSWHATASRCPEANKGHRVWSHWTTTIQSKQYGQYVTWKWLPRSFQKTQRSSFYTL